MTGSPTALATLLYEFREDEALALVRERLAAGDDPCDSSTSPGMVCRSSESAMSAARTTSPVSSWPASLAEIFEILSPALRRDARFGGAAKMLLCTVEGDIHDVGKDIAGALLSAHGLEIIDLGVDVPPERVAEAVVELRPDIVGLSGLLTEAFHSMQVTVALSAIGQLTGTNVYRSILGGSPLNQKVCDFAGADG